MSKLSSHTILAALKKHETLTMPDLLLEKNLGLKADAGEVEKLCKQLEKGKLILPLGAAKTLTYTITAKGLEQEEELRKSKQKVEAD